MNICKIEECGISNKNKLSRDVKELAKNIEILGSKSSDVLFLVSIYIDIGEYKKAEDILNMYNPVNLPENEKKNYHILKERAKKSRNEQFIKNLYEMGYSPKQIIELCEKEVSEYRAPYLDLRFITSVLEKCYGYFRKSDSKNDDNNKNKEMEKDELEL